MSAWCGGEEAARRLGITPAGVRARARRRTIEARGDGVRKEYFVPHALPDASETATPVEDDEEPMKTITATFEETTEGRILLHLVEILIKPHERMTDQLALENNRMRARINDLEDKHESALDKRGTALEELEKAFLEGGEAKKETSDDQMMQLFETLAPHLLARLPPPKAAAAAAPRPKPEARAKTAETPSGE